ncbi:MAG: superoxide dismutase [Verrucomicrobia bacterium]|nr:superoxide dismutase [Verrucomicrobiota bacterium]
MITRREAIKRTALLGATLATVTPLENLTAQPALPAPSTGGMFKLPPLPYAFDALAPHIDAATMEIHHGKHHAAYVKNLNDAVTEVPSLSRLSIEEIIRNLDKVPEKVRTKVRNNGGGHLNHALFWQMMKKNGGGEPKGELADAIQKSFGSYENFQERLSDAGAKQFGSGWAWLVLDGRDLKVESTPNQDNPLSQGKIPLLGIDVWEHAYYLKYQNRRADYISAFYNVINWDFVAERYKQAAS